MFSMSLHELTACIYYKLAIDRGLRGCNPEGERIAHAPHISPTTASRGANNTAGVHSINSYHHQHHAHNSSGSGSGTASGGGGGKATADSMDSNDFDCDAAKSEDIDKAIR